MKNNKSFTRYSSSKEDEEDNFDAFIYFDVFI